MKGCSTIEENNLDLPFLMYPLPWEHEKCGILQQFKNVIKRLPEEVQTFLFSNFSDPYFTQIRQNAGEPESACRTPRLIFLYQCIRKCQHDVVPYAICAISIITGLNPKIVLEHNRINLPQSKLDIIQAIHKKASRKNPEPYFSFNERIEASEKTEYLPSTLLWTLPTNPFNQIDISNMKGLISQQNDRTDSNILDDIPEFLTEQQKYFLVNPKIRRNLKSPFFYSHDLSEGFNPSHGLPPVPCFNEIDDRKPSEIRWIADLELPDCIPEVYNGCKCVNCDCCHCHISSFMNNKRTMRYKSDGTIDLNALKDCRPLIVECNSQCSCNPLHCKNRVVQNRSKINLMVVRSKSKSGWGVRAMEFIPRGSFVCEYLGNVIVDPQLAEEIGREYDEKGESYLFDLDAYGVDDDEMLTVDSSLVGNVSKFLNHMCDPNLVQVSIGTVESQLFHRIAFFAARDIYPNEEIGFHYGYDLDSNPEGYIGCKCGSYICRIRLR